MLQQSWAETCSVLGMFLVQAYPIPGHFFPPVFSKIYLSKKQNMNQNSCFVRKKKSKNNFKLMEMFLLLYAFSSMNAAIIAFSNHYTRTNTFQNSTVTKGRVQDRRRQKSTRKHWSNTSLHVGPVVWYHDITSSLSQQKLVPLPKKTVLPCSFLFLFLWLIILASASPVHPPFTSYFSPAQALMQKRANRAKYSYFYPCQLPDSSLCCQQLFLLAHIRGPEN